MVTLTEMAAMIGAVLVLSGSLDAFSDDLVTEVVNELDDGLNDEFFSVIPLDAIDETSVEFDDVDIEHLDVGEGRVSGAKIIECYFNSQLLEFLNAVIGFLEIGDDGSFSDLNCDGFQVTSVRG